jgi:phosphoglycolate phosphatase
MSSEQKNFDMIIWDWDGTIMNSTPTIVECMQKSCRDLGMPVPSDEMASHVIGLGIIESIRIAMPSVAEEDYPLVLERFRHYYLGKDHELTMFDGMRELLQDLKARGHILAVATGKPRAGLNRSLQNHALLDFFHDSRTADETRAKPHPQMLLELMDAWNLPAHRIVMIGDTTHDLKMAKSAGINAIAMSYGAHPSTN